MTAEAPQKRACANCSAQLQGPFCHVCGQRDADLRVAIWRLLVDLLSETFEADGKLVRTLPRFVLQPGLLVRDFVEGKRASFTSPVRLLVFALAFGFLGMGFGAQRSLDGAAGSLSAKPFEIVDGSAVIDFQEGGEGFRISVEPGSTFEQSLHALDGMNQRQAGRILLDGALDAAPTVALLLIPLMALGLELLFPKYLVIEHLLLAVLMHAQGLLLLGVAAVLGSGLVNGVVVLWLMGQLLYGIKLVYAKGWPETVAKWAALQAIYGMALVAGFVGVMLITLNSL